MNVDLETLQARRAEYLDAIDARPATRADLHEFKLAWLAANDILPDRLDQDVYDTFVATRSTEMPMPALYGATSITVIVPADIDANTDGDADRPGWYSGHNVHLVFPNRTRRGLIASVDGRNEINMIRSDAA